MINLTERQLRSVKLMLETGRTRSEIMTRFQLTESQVKRLLKRFRSKPAEVPPPWTPEEDAVALDLVGDKASYSVVASRIGRSRCAVAGRVRRLKRKESA